MNYGLYIYAWNLRVETYSKFAEVGLGRLHPDLWLNFHPGRKHTPDPIHAFHSFHQGRDLASTVGDIRSPKTQLSLVYAYNLDWS